MINEWVLHHIHHRSRPHSISDRCRNLLRSQPWNHAPPIYYYTLQCHLLSFVNYDREHVLVDAWFRATRFCSLSLFASGRLSYSEPGVFGCAGVFWGCCAQCLWFHFINVESLIVCFFLCRFLSPSKCASFSRFANRNWGQTPAIAQLHW